jgi:NitT/TauT family transport system substrate-binding protein
LLVREDTLKTRRAALEKLVAVFYQSWQAIVDGGEPAIAEAADIMSKRRPEAKMVKEQSMSSIREHIKYFGTPNTAGKPLGYQSEEDWKAVVSSLEAAKLIPTGTKATEYFTNDLIRAR